VKTGDLWLIFWLAILAVALLGYLFSKRREEDRQRLREQEVRRKQEEEQKRLRLLEHPEPEIKDQSERLPPEEPENWLRELEQYRHEKGQRKHQQERSQLEQLKNRRTESRSEEELQAKADEPGALATSLGQTSQDLIPEAVRNEVWRRDRGRCVICGSKENLAFDLLNSDSEGGSSPARNLHLLCQTCKRSVSASI